MIVWGYIYVAVPDRTSDWKFSWQCLTELVSYEGIHLCLDIMCRDLWGHEALTDDSPLRNEQLQLMPASTCAPIRIVVAVVFCIDRIKAFQTSGKTTWKGSSAQA